MSKTALVVGASGLIGRYCVEYLLEHSAYDRVKILVRRAFPLQHPKLTIYQIDFADLESHITELSADDVFCTLGTTIAKAGSQAAFRKIDFDYPVKIAAFLQHLEAQQFLIVTSMGADARSRVFYNRVKGEVEEALRKIPFNAIHFFRPSLLLGERNEYRRGERIGASVMSAMDPLFLGPLRKYRPILARDVAHAMVLTAQKNIPGMHIYESDIIQQAAGSAA